MNLNRLRHWMLLVLLLAPAGPLRALEDPYERYVNTSKDFRPVKQEKAWLYQAFPSWTYMPWAYQWTIGYTAESGRWSLQHGYNGAFIDRGAIESEKSPTGKLDWINQFQLRFYMDHTAYKHYLHLWDGDEVKPFLNQLHGGGVRVRPVNEEMRRTLQGYMQHSIAKVKSSPYRAAYALDDEISWGYFIHPCMWCVTDEKDAYANWLKEIYGPAAPERPRWITYEDMRAKLTTWSVGSFDASELMDQWTFNDSYWLNFIGDLVEYANSLDGHTPCGFVGGQAPCAFGGYDYAKIMRKVQYIESYNLGSSQAIIRSFNPHNAIPSVTTYFHHSVADGKWQLWYYLAHGNRGFIGWVQSWFDGDKPESAKPFHDELAPQYRQAAESIGPLMAQAEWIHDGVAIYYSHPSIQLGWILDAQAHRGTWINRNGDYHLGASHMVRRAWENMLRDSGLQYNFISYADVIQKGIPSEYKVLILPACLCLSDAEARRIKDFCRAGGTVIADYLPGLWDQHGKGRPDGGVLDDMFGVHHDPNMKAADLFGGGKLWCEVDQDANYGWKSYEVFLTKANTCIKEPCGFNKAVRKMATVKVNPYGKGQAVLMNLSPQWYNAYRLAGYQKAQTREVFMQYVTGAGANRWVDIKDAGEKEFGYEITYWQKDGRTIVFLCLNAETEGSETGGGNAVDLKTATLPVTLEFAGKISGVRDERTGKELPAGREFYFDWPINEAVVLSFDGPPPRK